MTKQGDNRQLADGNAPTPTSANVTIGQIAALLNISKRSVERAMRIDSVAPELMEDIKAGKLSLHAAEQQVKARLAVANSDYCDGAGNTVEDCDVAAAIEKGKLFDAAVRKLREAARLIDAIDEDDEHWPGVFLDAGAARGTVQWLINRLQEAKPYARCPRCNGRGVRPEGDGCETCKVSGFVTRGIYDRECAAAGNVEG